MISELKNSDKYVGFKQSRRAIEEGRAAKAFIAQDCDGGIRGELRALCESRGVPVEYVSEMKQLGEACGIDKGASVAVVLKV